MEYCLFINWVELPKQIFCKEEEKSHLLSRQSAEM
jgi:hypothetical protein